MQITGLMDNYNYPMGADTPEAPWNQVDNPEREIEVTISITLSRTAKIKVTDYEVADFGIDEDGEHFEDIDYSNCDLTTAVREQITLPNLAVETLRGLALSSGNHSKKDIENNLGKWNVDDLEVIKE